MVFCVKMNDGEFRFMEMWLLTSSAETCDHCGGSAYCSLSHGPKHRLE